MFIEVKFLRNAGLLIEAKGRLDIYNTNDYLDEIKKYINFTKELILDFSKIEYIASIGLRAILELHKTMQEKNGTMKIKNVSDEIMKIFKITGFNNFLNIENTNDKQD